MRILNLILILCIIQELALKSPENGNFADLEEKIKNSAEPQLNLDNDYTFDSSTDKKTGIIIEKDLTIDGNNHTINGLEQSKIFQINNANIILQNINFINGYSPDFGGAINLINSSLKIINCSFLYNSADKNGGAINSKKSEINISKSIFKFNQVKGIFSDGGGIFSDNSKIDIYDTIFNDNSADEGGAIYSINTTLNIFNTNFENNFANWYGGALLSDSELLIQGSKFNNNKAGYKGGAIHITLFIYTYNNYLYVDNSIFVNNNAEYGGAISSSNMQYVYISNSKFNNNYASFGSVISRMSDNNIEIINSSCYDNSAIYGGVLYSLSGGNNIFKNDEFKNNKADFGGLIYTISGRIKSQETNFSSNFINCNLIDNIGKKGLIYSIFDELKINNSNITYLGKSYDVPIIYKIISGKVIENNNWWGVENPDLDKLIIYEKENLNLNNNNKIINNKNLRSEGCASTVIQIDNNNTAFTFRRDSSDPLNVNIIYQKNNSIILQFKNDPDYFWHAIVSKTGWILGNGGIDSPYANEKTEAFAKIMVEKNKIIDEFFEEILKIKSMYNLGHFLIKSPNGSYELVIHDTNENIFKIEKGVLNKGDYIISPNQNKFLKKGKISDFKINENYTYLSRYLAAIDEYSSETRTNDFTYNYITNGKNKYVDIFAANDDGSLANKKDNSKLYNDISVNHRYILGEKIPIIMDGMYLDRFVISSDNENLGMKLYLNIIYILIWILIFY